jgi:transcriptional regulator with GAF, ATPase, and Fis domain
VAHGFLPKPFVPEQLLRLVEQFTNVSDTFSQPQPVELKISEQTYLVYASPCMRDVQQQAALVAGFNLPVLILGESGTGKEVIARYIHSLSRQAKSTFLKVNCAAVPSELLESELFGYEQGAFTGAAHARPGKFRLCDGGTIFLDEIGEMQPGLQAKLLQVLQDGTFSPLGSRNTVKVNVRVIAATNIDIKSAIANRTFREDLYYRLNGFCFTLPPLRERPQEIPILARHFLKRHSQELGLKDLNLVLSPRLLNACSRYSWPGNLRELEAFIRRYLVLQDEQCMLTELTREIADQARPANVTPETVLNALRKTGGNRRAAAKALDISYKRLLHTLRDFGLESVRNPL